MDWFKTEEDFKEASGYTIDGVWYPRVTKIIGIKAKPALYRYYAEAASYKDAQAITEKSAEEGTLIHELVQKIMVGESPDVPAAVKPAVHAAMVALETLNIQTLPEYIERRIVHYHKRYAGTIDALALINGKIGVLDIKTSQAIYRDYNLQTAAYMEPLMDEVQNLSTRWIFRIDQQQTCLRCAATLRTKGGREKMRAAPRSNGNSKCPDGEHEWSEVRGITELKEFPFWKDDYEAFLSAKELWQWENEYWLKKIGYAK